MGPETLFNILNAGTLLCWLGLIAAPTSRLVRGLVRTLVAPVLLALIYLAIVVFKFGQGQGGFDSLSSVMLLFAHPWVATAGWAHYLAFDLFVGIWIVKDAEDRKVSRWLTSPCLLATFMLGPIGLLLYLGVRFLAPRSIPFWGFVQDIYRSFCLRNIWLTRGAVLFIALGLVCLGLAVVDPRLVDDAPVWLKPVKFYFSIGIYFFTLAWLLGDLSPYLSERYVKIVTAYSLTMGGGELGIITVQAVRGVRSHYNHATILDSVLYGIMGLLIFINMLVVAHFGLKWWRAKTKMAGGYWLGGVYGLAIFTLSGLLACVMSALPWNRIGVYDPSSLAPFVGWNQAGGDLRISHFLGIHALQIMPLLGAIGTNERMPYWVIHVVGVVFLMVVIGLFVLAMMGLPLLA